MIEDLWQKLYFVKWDSKSFAMLARLAQDMLSSAQAREDERLIKLTAQLEHHIKICAAAEFFTEISGNGWTALLDALRHPLAADIPGRGRGLAHPPLTGATAGNLHGRAG